MNDAMALASVLSGEIKVKRDLHSVPGDTRIIFRRQIN